MRTLSYEESSYLQIIEMCKQELQVIIERNGSGAREREIVKRLIDAASKYYDLRRIENE